MRYILSRYIPPFERVLLIESGSRGILDRLIPRLYEIHGEGSELDLVTCYQETPAGFRGRVYRVQDYSGAEARQRLYGELAARQYSATGMLCSNEPIMTKWKWALAARMRSKVFIINEYSDVVFLDIGHWRNIVDFVRVRLGFSGSAVVPAVGRLLLFPFSLAYLLLFAAVVHTRRRIRLS